MEETYHASYLKSNIKPSDTFAAFMVTDLNTSGYSKAELTDFQNEAMELYNQAKLRNDKVKIKQFDYILYSIAKNLERAKSGSPSRSPSPMRSPSPIASRSRRSGSPVIVRRRRSPSPIRRVRPRVALSPSPSPPPQRRRQEPSSGGTRKRKHKSRKHKSKSRKYRK